MQLISLDQVFKILRPGVALPFGIRDSAGNLLLAKGHVVPDQERLIELLNRGMYVDAEEAKQAARAYQSSAAPVARVEKFSTRWEGVQRRLGILLRAANEPTFLKQVNETIDAVLGFDESQTDQILFLILRHDHAQAELYAEAHSLHVAALCHIISRRLGWPVDQCRSLVGAALTMNLSMANLQVKLVQQRGAVTPAQRKDIHSHPLASAALLRAAGVQDPEWLAAVEQHHEAPDGAGYPHKLATPNDVSQLVRFVDCFTAKHSARAGRLQQPAHQAARDLYAQSGGNPLAAALIKECGIYPPGCFVKLASGEAAVVVRRGATAKEPIVAVVVNANGEPLSKPVQRETAQPGRNIVGTLGVKEVRTQISVDQLYA